MRIAVVGSGISGLTASFHLARAGRRVAVLEASERVGGAIETYGDGAWRFEMGPNTVLENNESVGRLIRESGLDGEKITVKSGRIVKNPDNEKPTGQWNTIELLAVGPTSVHVVNGKVVMVLTGSRQVVDGKEVPLTKGKIQIQS